MKKIINSLTLLVLVAVIVSCEGTTLVDEVFDGTRSGTALRTLSSSTDLDLFDQSTSVSITVEQQDESNGANFASMNVYLSFTDNNFTDETDRMNVDEILLTNIPAASFTTSEKGLPQYTYSETFTNLIAALSLADGEFTGGDVFVIRLEAVMTNGDTWSLAEASQNITGSAYFNSPFAYNCNVVCAFADDTPFTGPYEIEQITPSLFSQPVFNTQVVTLTNEGGTKRGFEAVYLENFAIGNGAVPVTFNLICDKVVLDADQGSGLQCANGIFFGPAATDGAFDFSDDSSFTVTLQEDVNADCGGTADVTFQMTKQ